MPYPERLLTDRLQLRRWLPGDEGSAAQIWRDPSVVLALRPGDDVEPEVAATESHNRHLRHWEEHGFGLWLAYPRESAEVAGWAGAWLPDFVPALAGQVELAWTLRTAYRGQGLAAEAASAAREAAFAHLDAERLISLIAPANAASAAVATRIGMRRAGTATTDGGLGLDVYETRRGGRRAQAGG